MSLDIDKEIEKAVRQEKKTGWIPSAIFIIIVIASLWIPMQFLLERGRDRLFSIEFLLAPLLFISFFAFIQSRRFVRKLQTIRRAAFTIKSVEPREQLVTVGTRPSGRMTEWIINVYDAAHGLTAPPLFITKVLSADMMKAEAYSGTIGLVYASSEAGEPVVILVGDCVIIGVREG